MLPQEERSTRSQLLQMLKTEGSCSTGDMAKAMGITEMAVRRHIQAMERDGLISSALVRQPMGRPCYRYSLTDQADHLFPKNYSQLALDLFAELEQAPSGPAMIDRMFEGRRDKLVNKYRDRMANRTLEERVAALSEIQNDGGYMTSWSADGNEPDAYQLHEYNCPVSQVANQYRQACHCELQLFERLLGAEVERTECLADGGKRCTYAIRGSKAATGRT